MALFTDLQTRWASTQGQPFFRRVVAMAGPNSPDAYDDDLTVDDLKIDKERGESGSPVYGGLLNQKDYNPDWVGANGVANAERMRKSDGSIRSVLQVLKLPILRSDWKVIVNDEESATEEDRKIAQFCHDELIANTRRHESWQTVLRHVLLMLDHGFCCFEKVWTVDDEGHYTLRRLAPRLSPSIREIRVNDDGTLKSVVQQGVDKEYTIPGRYCLMLSYEKEGDNFWGVPVLRYVWQHYFYKTEFYRIDAIRLDRFASGLPVGHIEKGYIMKPSEKAEVIEILRGMRSHERSFALLPEQIKLEILTPETAKSGSSGLMEAVDHHDVMIARAVLALFLTAGSQKHGNYGTATEWADLFLFALQALCSYIEEEFNKQVIKELCDYNFDMTGKSYPKLKASNLEDVNTKELAAAMYNLVLGQVLTPDDTLEAHIRRLMGLPKLEEDQTREKRRQRGEVITPGSPAAAAPNVITGKPSNNDKARAKQQGEPTPGTVPGTTPPNGPIRVPGDRG